MARFSSSSRGARTVSSVVVALALLASACTDDDNPADGDNGIDLPGTSAAGNGDTNGDGQDPTGSGVVIEWTRSGSTDRGSMEVPLDHANPGAGNIEIGVARRPAADPDLRVGALLVNPGGPGASGLELAGIFGFLFSSEILDRFDIVTWDPRGVGESTQVRCGDGELMDRYTAVDPVPPDAATLAAVEDVVREFATACGDDSGWLLPHLNTEASARDMDLIREALGEDQISYLGFSYGTLLGATYAELFPQRVRSFVLDGAYSRSLSAAELSEGQAGGFEGSIDSFLSRCAARGCDLAADGDPGTEFDRIMELIRVKPVPTDDVDGRDLTVGLAWTAVLFGMYTPQLWGQLERGLVQVRDRGDGTTLLNMADVYNERSPGANYSTLHYAFASYNCMDSPATTEEEEREATERALAVAPRAGPVFVSTPSPCEFWPVESVGTTEPFSIPDARPILVVATTGDPATPYEWGVRLADELGVRLLSVEGDSHTAFAEGNRCVDRIVEAFLVDVALPDIELRCAA